MSAIELDDVLLVERKKVSKDGRVYVGRELANTEVKLVLVENPDDREAEPDD